MAILTSSCANAAVLGVDFGTDWFTMALANPGRPLDLVLNRDANRQTASVVTVNGLERTFGANAVAIAPRLPEKTFMSVRNLLGVDFESDVAAEYRKQFPNQMIRDPATGSVAFQYGAGANETLTVAEIVAMQLRYAQQLVKESEGIVVRDAVFTVPSFFDRNQRQAMLDAASLAGFRTLALVNDGSAVALNYAMSRSFGKSEKHVFYDMGAGKTVATVAGFSMRSSAKSKKATIINVSAFAADKMLGGQEVDFVVRDILVEKFVAGSLTAAGVSAAKLRGNARAMNRLLKEAKRVKTVLSANTEATASIEGLYDGVDFRAHLSRQDLEKATKHLVPRIRKPIDDALRTANLTIAGIDSIVLVGGGSRMPLVQRALSDAFGSDKLSRNVNAEEACVMGAVFKGATLSSSFRVKDMRLRDAMAYAVRGTYPTESKTILGGIKQEAVSLYAEFGAVGARRVIRSTRSTDFAIAFEAKASGERGEWSELARAQIDGIPEAAGKLKSTKPISEKPEVRVTVQTNELGAFEVVKAEAAFNVTNPGHALYVEDLAAWELESAQWQANTEAEAEAEDASAGEAPKPKKAKSSLRARPIAQPEVVVEVVPLSLGVEHPGLVKLSGEPLSRSRALLQRMDDDDAARTARHDAVNQLESLVYQLRELVEDDDTASVTTEQQRQALAEAVSAASEWLETNGEAAALADIKAQAAALRDLEKPIAFRKLQKSKRPEHTSALRAIIKQAVSLVELYRLGYTAEELEPAIDLLQGLEDTLSNTTAWLDSMVAKQEALAASDDPVLTTTDIDDKAVGIERSLGKLVAKKIKKKAPETTAAEPQTTDIVDDDEPEAPQNTLEDEKRDVPGHDEL
ncbi:lumenal Hsp70 protein [Coemansia thaxteri]|uniref:Lumenal Hsp70 protein n=1 Tax=Coemansia thaxteri TaxID=2663907 RepID=A0A9W8BEM8_9FUNG|nr:lumenal Hsp70 protein [Coemansia thaxteri]KAJ2486628.1 lumenal Hsp70 protein [Coemansia sp. RSA 2320]